MTELWQCPHCSKNYDSVVEAESCGCNYMMAMPVYECDECHNIYEDPGEAKECEKEDV